MNGRNSLTADQILERVRGAMVPAEATAARNFASIEARLGLVSSSTPVAHPEATAGAEPRAGNAVSKSVPKVARSGARVTRRAPALAARIGRLAAFGLATGLVGYLIGRSQAIPSAAVAPPAIVAPSTGEPLGAAPFAAVPPAAVPPPASMLNGPRVSPLPDAPREGASGAHSGTTVDEPPMRSTEPLAKGEGAAPRSRARIAPRALLHRAVSPAASVAPTAPAAPAVPAAPVDQSLQLGEALELLRRAESAVRNSEGLEARMLLGDLDRRAPREMLREERLATCVLADCILGDVAGARAALAELEQTNAESLYRARLETSCAAPNRAP